MRTVTERADGRLLCPSAPCRPGALLLGIVQAGGDVRFLEEPARVTPGFVAAAREGRRPEARFRFASPCIEGACSKWTEGGCGVGAQAAGYSARDDLGAFPGPDTCPIRPECRWFAERGPDVCRVCRWIVTERNDGPLGPEG